MGITHVVRGSEYLSSAPKYDLLYKTFGWEIPTYVHCSPVMRDAQNKMSKRHGDPSYEDLKAEGYLTEAILNYVALLGWSPKGELAEQEIFTLPELIKAFDIAGISKSPAIFDRVKLDHFNAVYLRSMAPEAFAKVAEPYIRQTVKGDFDIAAIAALLQARCERLSDIPEKVDFFDACPAYDIEFFTNKKAKTDPEVCKAMLEAAIPMLEALPDWTADSRTRRAHLSGRKAGGQERQAHVACAHRRRRQAGHPRRRRGDLRHSRKGGDAAPSARGSRQAEPMRGLKQAYGDSIAFFRQGVRQHGLRPPAGRLPASFC